MKKQKHKKDKFNILSWLKANKFLVMAFVIFLVVIFTRFYQLDIKNPFGYDQVDNAWAAKGIVADQKFPLVGMVAKANSGIYIGPAYYYFVAFFYYLTNLNPIASPIIAGVTALITFWIIYYFTKKIFNEQIALIALILNTFSMPVIIFERVQWPVTFIPAFSLVIFYLLYRIINGEVKKILWLAVMVGLMFNIHFTAIFFPIIILLCLPLFPRTKETLKYSLLAIPLFIVWIIPNAIYMITSKTSGSNVSYLGNNYHGFHVRRMIQIVGDAIIQYNPYLPYEWMRQIKVLITPIFFAVFYFQSTNKNKLKLIYLIALFYIVPWLIFTTYSGEITDYYFAINRYVGLAIISYLIYSLWSINLRNTFINLLPKLLIVLVLGYYCVYNFTNFLPYKDVANLQKRFIDTQPSIDHNTRVEFYQGVPEAYIYYYLMYKKTGKDVYK